MTPSRGDPVLVALLALAFAVRAGLVLLYPDLEGRGDEALHYVQGVLTGQLGHEVIGRWAPAYEAFLGLVFRLGGPEPVVARWAQVILSTATAGFVYGLAGAAGGRRAARVAGLLAALHPDLVAYSHYLYSETLFVFFLTGAAFAWLRAPDTSRGSLFATGVLLGLATLTRGLVAYFLPVWIAFEAWRGGSRAALRVAAVSGVALAVVLPWTLRNAVHHGGFLLVDPTLGRTAHLAFNDLLFNRDLGFEPDLARAPERPRCPALPAAGRAPLPPVPDLARLFPPAAVAFTRDAGGLAGQIALTRFEAGIDLAAHQRCEVAGAIAWARERPGTVLAHVAARLYAFLGPNSFLLRYLHQGVYGHGPLRRESYPAVKAVVVASHLLVVGTALLALGRPPLPPLVMGCVLFTATYVGLHALAVSYSRYRLPLLPFWIAVGAFWLARPGRPAGRARSVAIGLALAAFLALCAVYLTVSLP